MAPIEIDGTDITGATIDGTDVQEITVDGQTVFSAAPPIIDDFEDGNLNEYTVNQDGGTMAISTERVFNGNFSLKAESNSRNQDPTAISNTSGLPNYPSPGNTIVYYQNHFGRDGSRGGPRPNIQFNFNNGDFFQVRNLDDFSGDDDWSLRTNSNDVGIDVTIQNNRWYEVKLDWATNGDITMTVTDDTANNFIGSVTLSTGYTSQVDFISFLHGADSNISTGGCYWDFLHIE